jgi:hypothetical protein
MLIYSFRGLQLRVALAGINAAFILSDAEIGERDWRIAKVIRPLIDLVMREDTHLRVAQVRTVHLVSIFCTVF